MIVRSVKLRNVALLMLGRPGAGKGMLGGMIAKAYDAPHLNVDDELRMRCKNNPFFKGRDGSADCGRSISDGIVVRHIVEPWLDGYAGRQLVIISDVPKNEKQAQYLLAALERRNYGKVLALQISLTRQECISRMMQRASENGRGGEKYAAYSARMDAFDQEFESVLRVFDAQAIRRCHISNYGREEVVLEQIKATIASEFEEIVM